MTPCSIPAPAQGVVFQGSGWDTGLPEWVPERVDACTHTPLPHAYCAPRVGGFRTREDERKGGVWEPCEYRVGPFLSYDRTIWVPESVFTPCSDDWWDVSPGWTRCAS